MGLADVRLQPSCAFKACSRHQVGTGRGAIANVAPVLSISALVEDDVAEVCIQNPAFGGYVGRRTCLRGCQRRRLGGVLRRSDRGEIALELLYAISDLARC